jgi:hypothetical protein
MLHVLQLVDQQIKRTDRHQFFPVQPYLSQLNPTELLVNHKMIALLISKAPGHLKLRLKINIFFKEKLDLSGI